MAAARPDEPSRCSVAGAMGHARSVQPLLRGAVSLPPDLALREHPVPLMRRGVVSREHGSEKKSRLTGLLSRENRLQR